MAINIIDGFLVNAPTPLDQDSIQPDLATALLIPPVRRYEGKTIYILSEKNTYRWVGGIADANLVADITEGTRLIRQTVIEMRAITNPPDGIECYVIETNETYIYNNGNWNLFTQDSEENLIWGSNIQV